MQLEQFRNKYNYTGSTPMIQQYLDIKFDNIDCLLLFRMGDFYELFFEDAIAASRTLGIALTKRGKNGEEDIPMCGVPHHALEVYLKKLIENGYKVAICDQLETPEEAKKRGGYKAVVTREVTRIITPGTVTEESLIAAGNPNYLVSIFISKGKAAICYADLTTSEIGLINLPEAEILHELARLSPREILLGENLRSSQIATLITSQLKQRITYQVDSFFAFNKCQKAILDFYKISSLKAIGELTDIDVCAAGSALEYLSLTQKSNVPQLPLPRIVNYHGYMNIDMHTRRNLEITSNLTGQVEGSLLGVIDHTVTKAGSRLLYKFLSAPLINITEINDRLAITEFFYNNISLTKKLQELLKKTGDLERCLTRVAMNRSTPRDLLGIKYTLDTVLKIREEFIHQFGLNLPDNIEKILEPCSGDEELHELIDSSIKEDAPGSINNGGVIRHDYHPKIEELYDLISGGRSYIEDLKIQYQKETAIDSLKIIHNNVLGLFIEITARHSNKILDSKFIHRQTTANTVRYTTAELQKLESNMVNAKVLVINLEQELYNKICQQITEKSAFLIRLAESISLLDVFASLAIVADEYNYTRPVLSEDHSCEIIKGRHPVIERRQLSDSQTFISNNCILDQDSRIWLITGPNMAGKSTFLRQNALIVILAQVGSFVPATSAKIGLTDRVFSRIGSGDDLLKGQSTFMVEMLELSAILAQASERSLIILDEVGRGTSTYDGVAIAWSVLEYIHDKLRCRCLFATHYYELTDMDKFLPALKNYTVAIEEVGDNVLFLHHIIAGTADKSYGIYVAGLAGLPQSVLMRANELLAKLEKLSLPRNKNLLKSESQNLNLFTHFSSCVPSASIAFPASLPARINSSNSGEEEEKTQPLQNLITELTLLDPDQLTPRQALEVVYRLKKHLNPIPK